MQEEKISLKDLLINEEKVKYFASLLNKGCTKNKQSFSEAKFAAKVMETMLPLEFKERLFLITEIMIDFLPKDFSLSNQIILDSLPEELDPNKTDDDFGEFIIAPFGYFYTQKGMDKANVKQSLIALGEITKRFSMEYAVRFFINEYEEQSFKFLQEKLVCSKNYHQRRLVSETLRPKLPWAIALKSDYKKALPLLDILVNDKTRYVTRSVANHLNDIAKIDEELVLQKIAQYQKLQGQNKSEMAFISKHALRTLIKNGNLKALSLIGIDTEFDIEIKNFTIKNNTIFLGDYLEFSFDIISNKEQKLFLDYRIFFKLKNTKNAPRVFRLKQLNLKKGEKISLNKKHLFKKMTTKKLYQGEHFIDLQINGKNFLKTSFELKI